MSALRTYPDSDQRICSAAYTQPSAWPWGFCASFYPFHRYKFARFSHIALAFLLLINSSGFGVFRSFCCKKLTSITLYAPAESACHESCAASCEDEETNSADTFLVKNGCCQYFFDFYKWVSDITVESHTVPLAAAGLSAVSACYFQALPLLSRLPLPYFAHPAPMPRDITLWNQVFRL